MPGRGKAGGDLRPVSTRENKWGLKIMDITIVRTNAASDVALTASVGHFE
jgi:hypothetical protein